MCLGAFMPRDPVGIFIEDGRVLVVGSDFAAVAGAEGDLGERAVGDRVPKETGGVSDQDAVVETGFQGRIAEGLHGAGADGVICGFAEGEDTQRGSVGFRRDKEDTLCIVDVARAEVLDVGLGVGGVEGEGVRGDAKRVQTAERVLSDAFLRLLETRAGQRAGVLPSMASRRRSLRRCFGLLWSSLPDLPW